ncbi:MAG: nitrite/sulfite reductase [Lachnospiraceae bacterium]|nr:nitrite/sulfite reductase [Lachnospiraceae bacterium]
MKQIIPDSWKQELNAFKEKTEAFYAGELDKNSYKGFSGKYGSYAQKGGKAHMLRLRMTAGRLTKEKMAFAADAIRNHSVDMIHFTTCQTLQLHNLQRNSVYDIMEHALDCGIVTMGGGGDYPRNVMCSPLSGVEKGEYFDVMPYAEATAEYAMSFINAEKMPRKLKIGFSSSPSNIPHVTFRDLGFAAREDGAFDVYSAGGLGSNPKFGVKIAEAVRPDQVLYYVKAMWLTFRSYGNYENRGKARTRYMVEALGGAENYKNAFLEKLKEVMDSGEDLTLHLTVPAITKQGDGSEASGPRVIAQKQAGLYAVKWHPIGGSPAPEDFCALYDVIKDMEAVELRLDPDETVYIINLTGAEAEKVLDATANGAESLFEYSVSCIGASICQQGVRDSQALLRACVQSVRDAKIPCGALPLIHISGCPSSCGTHQTGAIGFRGGVKLIDKVPHPAFVLYVNGCSVQGREAMGREVGTMLEAEIPAFLVSLGNTVAASGMTFEEWNAKDPSAIDRAAAPYLK